jgi:hypothetical protein
MASELNKTIEAIEALRDGDIPLNGLGGRRNAKNGHFTT